MTVALAIGHADYRTFTGPPAGYGSTCTPAKSGLFPRFGTAAFTPE